MNNAMNLWDTLPESTVDEKDALQEVEDTLAELEIYLDRYPEDDIARMQYEQFTQKREALAAGTIAGICKELICLESIRSLQNAAI
ncbi:hypothetical protein ACFOLF_03830 [Paenibacillus sepulcri]|uniref:Uncharacterized protein n=1 Tax=Paenibacillus sepulcri TaxID=359917 RepID=A0ABS7CE40_9BACL|nr:hypothetical protein [Paenibacillus sepulcri]